jgi:16S rRNA (adenine1518-N6/adenine1519-N6)-dimethyltransferase
LNKPLPWALKKLGQHYLNDKNIIDLICTDFPDLDYPILEIGPGPGILTQHLSQQNRPLIVVEKDTRFEENLLEFLTPDQIIWGDALKQDFSELFKSFEKIWLVSNLPYNVASPLLINFIQEPKIKAMTLMFQKEVGDRILTEDMNSLGALSNTFFKIKMLCKVPPSSFLPPPKVDSIVLSFERLENPEVDLREFPQFETFLRNLFKMRRKQVGSVLKTTFDKVKVEKVLADLNIDTKTRAETFSLREVIDLYRGFNGN